MSERKSLPNPLTDEEKIMAEAYRPPQVPPQTKEAPRTIKTQMRKTIKTVKQSKEPNKKIGKPPSFEEPTEKVTVKIPERLVNRMRKAMPDLGIKRFDKFIATAIEHYLKANRVVG